MMQYDLKIWFMSNSTTKVSLEWELFYFINTYLTISLVDLNLFITHANFQDWTTRARKLRVALTQLISKKHIMVGSDTILAFEFDLTLPQKLT